MQTPEQMIRAQREELETLREENRQLREALAPRIVLPMPWRLTDLEEQLLCALRASGPNLFHRERAIFALYGIRDDAPGDRIVDCFIANIRRKLKAELVPIYIRTVWGRGWQLTPESCAAFDAAIEADRARWDQQRRAA